MALKDPYHWFPNQTFNYVFLILVLLAYGLDYGIGRQLGAKGLGGRNEGTQKKDDRGSFGLIQLASLGGLAAAVFFRWMGWGLAAGWPQYLGLALVLGGSLLRSWSLIRLGQFFSRTVEIEAGHQLVTGGPYRWLRHPAYTGMLLINLGAALALGTWAGALISLALILAATLYRIRVEERVLLEKFGEAYRRYMQQTWRLFPGW